MSETATKCPFKKHTFIRIKPNIKEELKIHPSYAGPNYIGELAFIWDCGDPENPVHPDSIVGHQDKILNVSIYTRHARSNFGDVHGIPMGIRWEHAEEVDMEVAMQELFIKWIGEAGIGTLLKIASTFFNSDMTDAAYVNGMVPWAAKTYALDPERFLSEKQKEKYYKAYPPDL